MLEYSSHGVKWEQCFLNTLHNYFMWVLCSLQNPLSFFHHFFFTLCVWWMQPRPEQEASFPCLRIPMGLQEFGSPTWDGNKFREGELSMAVTHGAKEPWHLWHHSWPAQPHSPDREELELSPSLSGCNFRTENISYGWSQNKFRTSSPRFFSHSQGLLQPLCRFYKRDLQLPAKILI